MEILKKNTFVYLKLLTVKWSFAQKIHFYIFLTNMAPFNQKNWSTKFGTTTKMCNFYSKKRQLRNLKVMNARGEAIIYLPFHKHTYKH